MAGEGDHHGQGEEDRHPGDRPVRWWISIRYLLLRRLEGLWELGVTKQADYLSVVSGGSWIGTSFAMAEDHEFFFKLPDTHPSFMEEGFESLLPNPERVTQEAALARKNANYVSNIFGRLLAKTFLREHGDHGRWKPLSDSEMIRDQDRPFLIINGTVNFRRPDRFDITQECFEMTRLYCGSRSLGYLSSEELLATQRPIRIRDGIAISGAAVALHLPGFADHVGGAGLGREIVNYTLGRKGRPARPPTTDDVDLADGGHYNNLGIESLISRGCGYIILVDAEHDAETKTATRSNQKYHGLRTLLGRHHIKIPKVQLAKLDRANEAVHVFKGNQRVPDILYIKLKSSDGFDAQARKKDYNQQGFLASVFGRGEFAFDPQYSTAKLDYDFVEHRNLTELGMFFVRKHKTLMKRFAAQSK